MISLILKDLYTQMKYVGLIALIYAIFTIAPGMPGEAFLSMGVVMTAFRLAYLEDKNNTLGLLRTMPVKASSIVFSKFFAELIVVAFFTLLSAVHLTGLTGRGVEGFYAGVAAMSLVLIFAGVTFALSFRFGYMKASTYMRILFFAVFIPFFIPGVAAKLELALKWFSERVPLTWGTGLLAELILLAIYFAIGGVAVWLFQGREE